MRVQSGPWTHHVHFAPQLGMVLLEVFAFGTIGAVVVMEVYLLKKMFTDRNFSNVYGLHATTRGGTGNRTTTEQHAAARHEENWKRPDETRKPPGSMAMAAPPT